MKNFKTTDEISIPPKIVDQVIGQDNAVDIVKKAAKQHRNVLLIGDPGTGKTLLAQAIAELLPVADLEDVLVYKNINDENKPVIRVVKTYPHKDTSKALGDGEGRQIIQKERLKNRMDPAKNRSNAAPLIIALVLLLVVVALLNIFPGYEILFAALILGALIFGSMLLFVGSFRRAGILPGMFDTNEPKLIVDNTGMTHAPFLDGTGARAGALFGDVKHDPLQCILPGEKISLENGNLINIERLVDPHFKEKQEGEVELEPGATQKILGGMDSEFKLSGAAIRRVYKRRYVGKILKIYTRSGSSIKVTPNHPIAVLDKYSKIQYIEAGKISAGDRIILPERINKVEGRKLDEKFVIFIADLLADGYIGSRHIEFNLKREFKINEITKDIERLGYIPKIKIRSDGATQIAVNSAALCKELSALGVVEGKEKRIPDIIFTQDMNTILVFVSRLISLDGYVNRQGQFEILSSSKTFVQQLRALLFIAGINAKYKTRIDTGYGKEKGTVQNMLKWNHFDWSKAYFENTVNNIHKANIAEYLEVTTFNKESYDDIMPVDFSMLDKIRSTIGISKESVHQDFWSLNPNLPKRTNLTRNLLKKINTRFNDLGVESEETARLKRLSEGDYAFDEITGIDMQDYDGFVYNLTTESGNYLVDFVLTHNSGGLGTPAHLRVESGYIHRANKGVLFIDEIADLEPKSQQELLTAMQEKKYSITGQSEMSSGALVRTETVPCDFLLVAAGNLQDIQKMHPALRSRIRGYGYEVYMESSMPDTEPNREKIIRFIAQEVKKDGKIPPFDYDACMLVIEEARRRSSRKNRITLVLRELGGVIRAAGDIAVEKGHKAVTKEDVRNALLLVKPIEAQYVEQTLDYRKDYKIFKTAGYSIGRVNGLAVVGSSYLSAGIVLPIVAEVTKASSRTEGRLIPTGKLGKIAKEAVKNISAIIKRHMNRDMTSYDIHVQFIQTYEGVEGDSASISVAVAVISALEGIPVNEEVAMTGSLSVRGDVLPVGGITNKIMAAIEAGMKQVIIPESNAKDIYIEKDVLKKIKVMPVKNIADVLDKSLKESARSREMVRKLRKYITTDSKERQPLEAGQGLV